MMKVIFLIAVSGVCLLALITIIIFNILENTIRLRLGYRKYEYTYIPSYGDLVVKHMWHKSDDEALADKGRYDIVKLVLPKSESRTITQ